MAHTINVGSVKEEHCESTCNMFKTQDWPLTMRHRDLGLVKIEQDMSFVWQSSPSVTLDGKDRQPEKQAQKKFQHGSASEKPFKCAHCPKDFATSSNLKVHLTRTHSGDRERPFLCPNCPKSFATNDNLQKHIRRHSSERNLNCPHCPKAFATKDNLQKHIRRHSSERNLICPHCPKAFATNDNLQKHIRRHSSERTLNCPHCPKAFATNDNLQRHIRGHTEHTGEKPFKCPFCPKECVRSEGLKKHIMRLHKDKDIEPEQLLMAIKPWPTGDPNNTIYVKIRSYQIKVNPGN
ncbi:gastrula zinc finger protein XlCGF7.1-like isoform X2 [Drosophila montana]|uniref:gastrula zinc finger protein XlCGF7.1-like isoform X2 n=1 Tax=Drosophila montana TaxID=40370 RepID=UPI00313BB786